MRRFGPFFGFKISAAGGANSKVAFLSGMIVPTVRLIPPWSVESKKSYNPLKDRWEKEEPMNFTIEIEQEEDGRCLSEVLQLPGVLVSGQTREEAIAHVQALALRVVADRLEHGEAVPQMANIFSVAP